MKSACNAMECQCNRVIATQVEITYPILGNRNSLQHNKVIAINERHYNNITEELCLLLQLCIDLVFPILQISLIQPEFAICK